MFPHMHTSDQRSVTSQVSPSDAQLRARIQAEMHRHGEVDATKIGVVVRGGEVLLWGSVASEHERTLAGQIAARLTARTAVINHIQVFRTTQS
jgi:osmotically-inducible protein OsmY